MALVKIFSSDPNLQRLQDNVSKAISEIGSQEGQQKVILRSIDLSTTPIAINHGLDRVPVGYLIVRQNANATIWESTGAPNPQPKKKIVLAASAAVTVDIWIF